MPLPSSTTTSSSPVGCRSRLGHVRSYVKTDTRNPSEKSRVGGQGPPELTTRLEGQDVTVEYQEWGGVRSVRPGAVDAVREILRCAVGFACHGEIFHQEGPHPLDLSFLDQNIG